MRIDRAGVPAGTHDRAGPPHRPRVAELLAVHLGGLAAVAAVLAAASLAATGVLARRISTPRRLPVLVAWTATIAGAALAIAAVTVTVASIVAGNWPLGLVIGALTLASHTRIAASARACARPSPAAS